MFCTRQTKAPQVMVVSPVSDELSPVGANKALALLPLRNVQHPNAEAKPTAAHKEASYGALLVSVCVYILKSSLSLSSSTSHSQSLSLPPVVYQAAHQPHLLPFLLCGVPGLSG